MKLSTKTLTINIFLAIVVTILINMIFYFGFFRLDLTSNRVYSLSKASKRIIKELKDYVLIKAIFSKELPEQYRFIRLYVEDMLKEYKTYSREKIKFEFIDPAEPKSKLNLSEVYSLGIIPVRFTTLAKDKYEVKEGFMGIAFLLGDKKEVIPVISNPETLEYDITSTLKRLTLTQKKTIGFVTGHNEPSFDIETLPQIKEQISQLYNIENINLNEFNSIPDTDALVIAAPKQNYNEKELFILDQYILAGKPVAFLLSKYNINTQHFSARKVHSNIYDLLKHYGIEIKDALISDFQCQKIALRTQHGFFIMENILDYPFIPIITSFNTEHPLVKDLHRVELPFVSPIEVTTSSVKVKYSELMKTSKNSYLKENVYTINPLAIDFRPGKDAKKGPFIVGAEIYGIFTSYFSNQQDKIKNFNLSKEFPILTETSSTSPESRVVVISTSEIFSQEELFGNLIDYIAQDYDLVTIRSKKIKLSPLKQVPLGVRVGYKYVMTLLFPGLTVLSGILWWYYRKNRVIVL